MAIEISKEARAELVASLRRYFDENMDEPIGELKAGLLLNYVLKEIGPVIYNHAIADAQKVMQQRVGELDSGLYEPEYQYWPELEKSRKKR